MGQKVNPIGFRLPVTKAWQSRWFARKKDFGGLLLEDLKVRDFVKKALVDASVSKVVIERFAQRLRVNIHSARPGFVIGKNGEKIEELKAAISKMTGGKEVYVDIKEIGTLELDAQLVAESIAQQLCNRVSFRRAMKRAMQTALNLGAEGVKVRVSGRLGGAELARTEQYKEGKVPLHTLRANIDYGFAEAATVAGKIGVKVWICKPEGFEESKNATAKPSKASKGAKGKMPGKRDKKQQA